jgi:predicted nuclease with TOPRIM domain
MSQYNRISIKYQIITVVLAVGSAIVLFVPIKQFKPFKSAASYLMSASIISFITTRHSMRDVLDEAEKIETEYTDNIQKMEKENVILNEKITAVIEEIETLKLDRDEQQAELATCQQALKEARFFNKETAHDLVEECHRIARIKCECHIAALLRNYAECEPELNAISLELEVMKLRFLDKISDFKTLNTFEEVIDEGLDLQKLIITQYIELRCKAQSVIITYLLGITKDAVPYPDFQKYVESYQFKLDTTAQEFTELINDSSNLYSSRLDAALEPAKEALQQLEVTQYQLQNALTELEETKKPFEFSGASSFANMANSVSAYYYKRYQFLLDALHWEETDTGLKVIYSIRRNPGLVESEISADNSLEQTAAFCNALHGTMPKWEFNRQFSQLILTVIHRRTVKVKSGDELPRGVLTTKKFVETVKHWRRVRITGGSESGKSPTAENVICAILSEIKGTCDFYDPMYESVKNFRTIPAIGHSHANSVQGLKDYQAKMQSTPSDSLYLAWFDEIDTTLDENPKSASDLKAVLKQSSHKNSGLIITGQNANVRNLKGGFDRSDMNNFICLHIGDNYRDAIANSHLSESEKANLMKTGDALTDYCAAKNDEDGLDHTDPSAYRFALVLEPNKKGYFMILPEFGEYVWQEPEATEATEAIDTDEPTEATDAPSVTVRKKNPQCPQCSSESKKNGFLKNVTPRVQKWKCKNSECGREFH